MDGRLLVLGTLATLAGAGSWRRRGSRASQTPPWQATPEQVADIRRWWTRDCPSERVLLEVPFRNLQTIDFRGRPEEMRTVRALMAAFEAGAAMEPMVGYPDHWNPGRYIVHDGNHRVAAARRLGLTRGPMLVCDPPAGHRLKPPSRSP